MKAIVYTKYGPPDVLELKEVAKPTPRDDEVLIKVQAVSVNRSDWELLRGKPLYARIRGLLRPRHQILGSDIAGRVEMAGRNIRRFQPGDEVFGDIAPRLGRMRYGLGGFAEYVCAREGAFAVQLSKLYGAEVTGVDNTGKLHFMRSLGADHVIDYTREDFTKNGKHYDLILDVVAHRSAFAYKRALRPNGSYFLLGGSVATLFQILLLGPWIRRTTGQKIRILAVKPNLKDIVYITELYEAGKVVPVIDRRYQLSEVPEALRYLGEGRTQGKVVITV